LLIDRFQNFSKIFPATTETTPDLAVIFDTGQGQIRRAGRVLRRDLGAGEPDEAQPDINSTAAVDAAKQSGRVGEGMLI
jgi:hypothetical protein